MASKKAATKKEPATKKPAALAESLPSRALEHGAKAFGAKFLKPGFALTPQLDLAFALGRGAFDPVQLLPDAPAGVAVAGTARAHQARGVARNVALAELRHTSKVWGEPVVPEESPAPLEVEEAQTLLRERFPSTADARYGSGSSAPSVSRKRSACSRIGARSQMTLWPL